MTPPRELAAPGLARLVVVVLSILSVCEMAACAPVDPVTGMPVERSSGAEWRIGRARSTPAGAPAPERREPRAPREREPDAAPGAPARGSPALASQEGDASWYSDSLAGGPTASGERYQPRALTAAHRRLPLGTWVRVTRRDTGASVIVRINDRGPFGNERRILDLSRRAAETLHMIRRGVAPVRLEVLRYGDGRRRRRGVRRR